MSCADQEESLCNRCTLPGKCCIGFDLGDHFDDCDTPEQVVERLRNAVTSAGGAVTWNAPPGEEEKLLERGYKNVRRGLPFQPLWRRLHGGWRFWCPVLNIKTGRCGDYENRPALCVAFEPGSDRLCAMHEPKPASIAAEVVKLDAAEECKPA